MYAIISGFCRRKQDLKQEVALCMSAYSSSGMAWLKELGAKANHSRTSPCGKMLGHTVSRSAILRHFGISVAVLEIKIFG